MVKHKHIKQKCLYKLFLPKSKILKRITESQKIRKIIIRKFAIFSSGLIFKEKFPLVSFFFVCSKVINIRCSVET